MHAPIFALLLALGGLAGCLDAPAADDSALGERAWRLRGSFTQERTEEDLQAVCDAVREHNPDCALLESFPEQFAFTFPSVDSCSDARVRLAQIPHVTVGNCERQAAA